MSTKPSQLLLLSDHIKLSLLERQRAISLNLPPSTTQESHISRSLESLREGLQTLESKALDADDADVETLRHIRAQYNDLFRQFHGDHPTSTTADTLSSPNDPSLAADFKRASSIDGGGGEQRGRRSSNLKAKDPSSAKTKTSPKSVRFRDTAPNGGPFREASEEEEDPNRSALFPPRYTDEENSTNPPDPTAQMDNQQIHTYHQQVLQEQDDQLDRLGESIRRQGHLSMQIGDELEGQITLLDEVDHGVDRHQSRLDGARRRLTGVSRKATQNMGTTTIILLIVVLVFLLALLK